MSTAGIVDHQQQAPWRRSARAVAVLFFVNGATFSNWLPRIPEVRDRLGVSNAGLGAALIGGGLGGLVASLVVARLLRRVGSRRCLLGAAGLLAAGLPLFAVVPNAASLLVLLSALGALDVINDLAMNAQGVMVQQRLGRSIMQRLHAAWSLGFLAGAAVGSLAAAARLGLGAHLLVVAAVLVLTVVAVNPWLLRHDDDGAAVPEPMSEAASGGAVDHDAGGRGAGRRARRPVVVRSTMAMACLAVGVAVIEAMPNDWSAVALRDIFHAGRGSGAAALLYAAFMLVGRLGGDAAVERFGAGRLLDVALAGAAGGMALLVVAPGRGLALGGFALWGLGVSVLFPQLYAFAATLPGTTAGAGLAAMALGQRMGFLLEPVGVGSLASAAGLRVAVAAIGGSALLLVLGSRRFIAPHDSLSHRR